MKRGVVVVLAMLALTLLDQSLAQTTLQAFRLRESALASERIFLSSPMVRNGIILGQPSAHSAFSEIFVTPKILNPDGAAKSGQFPFIVAIGSTDASKGFQTICGGSVVHPRFVLTAAHCAEEVTRNLTQVMWGQVNLKKIDPKKVSTVIEVFRHEAYLNITGNRFDNDVALLYVDPPMNTSAVLLAESGPHETGQDVVVMGWGSSTVPVLKDGQWVMSFPDRLYYVALKTTTSSDCMTRYGALNPPTEVTGNMFCAAAGQKDTCNGDSGGPVVFKAADGRWRQVGVVS
ncbi:MAG: S1 family serine peptidase, partial [Pseudomonadales bacterium]